MPTLRSLGVHPDLCHRLVTESSDSTKGYNAISTPQALLSRNPDQLRLLDSTDSEESPISSRPIPLPQAEELRSQIASAMIRNGKTGLHLQQQRHRRNLPGNGDADTAVPTLLSALDLLHPTLPTPLSSGIPSLDRAFLLEGSNNSSPGIPWGTVTQLSGPPGAGKTRFAIGLAQRAAASGLVGCWYLYSGATPVHDLLVSGATTSGKTTTRMRGPISSPHQLLAHLAELEEELLEPSNTFAGTVLILDSCSGCCAPTVDHGKHYPTSQNNPSTLLNSHVALTLKRLTRLYHLTTLVVNGTVADGTKPAMGTVWNATVPDTAVWMTAEQLAVTHRQHDAPTVLARPAPR